MIKGISYSYPKFGKNLKIFLRPIGFCDQQLVVSDYYNGSTLYSFMSKQNVAGVSLCIRWDRIEISDGVYNWTYLDSLVNDAKNNWGKEVAFYLFTSAYIENQSYVPAYIRNDHATYGGSPGHGGELKMQSSERISWVNWQNQNVVDKFNNFLLALGSRYKNQISYLYMDEFWTDVNNTSASSWPGGPSAVIQAFKNYYVAGINAFSGGSAKVFCKFNYLKTYSSNELADIVSVIQWAADNNYDYACELAAPYPYNWRYPKNLNTTINSSGYLTTSFNTSKLFDPTRTRLANSDSLGATFGAFTAEQAINNLRIAAYSLEGTDNQILDIQLIDGMPRPDQPTWGKFWLAIGPLIESGYLR